MNFCLVEQLCCFVRKRVAFRPIAQSIQHHCVDSVHKRNFGTLITSCQKLIIVVTTGGSCKGPHVAFKSNFGLSIKFIWPTLIMQFKIRLRCSTKDCRLFPFQIRAAMCVCTTRSTNNSCALNAKINSTSQLCTNYWVNNRPSHLTQLIETQPEFIVRTICKNVWIINLTAWLNLMLHINSFVTTDGTNLSQFK